MNAVAASLPADNPFAKPSTLPYQMPPLDKIKDEHIARGLEAGMEEELKEVEAIANNSAAPTFENTIVALEKSGDLLDRPGECRTQGLPGHRPIGIADDHQPIERL